MKLISDHAWLVHISSYFVVASLLDACLRELRVGFLGVTCSCGRA